MYLIPTLKVLRKLKLFIHTINYFIWYSRFANTCGITL